MNQEANILPIRFYVFSSFSISLMFLLMALLLMAIFIGINQGILFILVLNLIFCPLVGILGWLFDKGSRGENRLMTLKSIGGYAGIFYGAIAGAMIASELFGSAAGILGFILLFLVGLVVGVRLGPMVGEHLAGFMGTRI
jgi:hypothetical protein